MTCKAKQYSDQMCCGRCGLSWDVNDPDPPECLTDEQIQGREWVVETGEVMNLSKEEAAIARAALNEFREKLKQ